MKKVEMFFDYSCPFCFRGFRFLTELLPDYPHVEMVWRPLEIHPRPDDDFGKHSDLCLRTLFFAVEKDVDLMAFHKKMFSLYHYEKINVEDIDTLAEALTEFLDADELRRILKSGKYEQELKDACEYAFKKTGIWIIPAFRMESHKLDAPNDTDLTIEHVRDFLDLSQ